MASKADGRRRHSPHTQGSGVGQGRNTGKEAKEEGATAPTAIDKTEEEEEKETRKKCCTVHLGPRCITRRLGPLNPVLVGL